MRYTFLVLLLIVAIPARAQVDPLVCEDQARPNFCFMEGEVVPVTFGHFEWGDLDRDGDMDLVIQGNRNTRAEPAPVQQFYRNDGDTFFLGPPRVPDGPPSITYVTTYIPLFASPDSMLWDGGNAMGDANGDGFLDLAVSGITSTGDLRTDIYLNAGNNTVSLTRTQSFEGLRSSSVAWGDADNDGDLDLAISGLDENGEARLWLAVNDGNGTLTTPAGLLEGAAFGRVVWGDYDQDGDRDLLVSGVGNDQQNIVRIYRNSGGTFTPANAGIRGVLFAAADWGDYDADGDLDILVAGGQLHPFVVGGLSRVYRNDAGAYTEATVFDGMLHGTAAWIDYDNDGDLDAFSSGAGRISGEVAGFTYRNDSGSFTRDERFGGGLFGDAALGDYDMDGDVDVFIFGNITNAGLFSREYRNELAHSNTPPNAPSLPIATPGPATVVLSWGAASDGQTPAAGLTYNVRVGTTPGGNEVVPAMSNPVTSKRLQTARGNVDHQLTWTLSGLASGTYYWAVQAIDPSGTTSPFTVEQSFVIP